MAEIKQVCSVSDRLKEALRIKNMKQVDLVEKTKIQKASIHQYVSGYVEPKSDRLYLLAKALDVNPVWLMGLDAPMDSAATYGKYSKESADLMMDALDGNSGKKAVIQIMNTMTDAEIDNLRQYALFVCSQRKSE